MILFVSRFIVFSGALCGFLMFFLWTDPSPLLIESLESKTIDNQPVFNKIQYQSSLNKDIWLMEQSHQGLKAPQYQWDKLAIVVDNKTKQAEFFQLENGNDKIALNLEPINFKVSCYLCHANGPRAIRPNLNSLKVKISTWDQGRIMLWNLRIKTYGPLQGKGIVSQVPFRIQSHGANELLLIKVCQKCHNSKSWFGRGELTKQNFLAIGFMVENNHMPPLGFSLSPDEKKRIFEFIKL